MCFSLGFQHPPWLILLQKQALLLSISLHKPVFMQLCRQCGEGAPKATEKMLQQMCCCCASTKAEGCSTVKHMAVSVSPLRIRWRKCMLSAFQLSTGKMVDFLLKLFWYQVVVTWESLIHKLWVGNREGGGDFFFCSQREVSYSSALFWTKQEEQCTCGLH